MTTYKDAGVDIDAGDDAVRRIAPLAQETFSPNVLTEIGAFGAFYEPDLSKYNEPVLVSSIDGVGTKLKVAVRAERYDTIGQDLVNHCVNDIAVSGARPLFFLDYYGTGTLDPAVAEAVAEGLSAACQANGCALIGGEVAEMPDVYGGADFDLVGTIVGMAEKRQILDERNVEAGDVLLGLPSTGLHTNGYTLARQVLFDAYSVDDTPDALGGETVGEALLRVHRSYLAIIQRLMGEGRIHAAAHITGGGLHANTRRVVPAPLTISVDFDAWTRPPLFQLIQDRGDVPEEDMRRTFNCGIGLVVILPDEDVAAAQQVVRDAGSESVVIGRVHR